ncbi:MAG TPA: hypothetical protein VEL79_11130 [Vicinamibacterales bacterium]|nr:hypothetical protein [Vicinamibacterales bacterium]
MLSVLCTAFATALAGRASAGADVVRTVYFSAVDAKGVFVTDLTAAELTVKEGGKERAIGTVAPATAPMQVTLIVDDGGTGGFQAAVSQFLEVMLGHGQFAITVLNPQPDQVTGFTEDVDALKTALTRIGPRGRVVSVGEQIMEAVEEAAKALEQRKAARPSIVVMTAGGEQAQSNQAEPALNALKRSGASLSVLYLTGLNLGQVLGDGPKQSGGMTQQVNGNVVVGPVLAKIADNLLHQYVLTYTLPDGVKPNEKLSLTTSRKGVTLLAPSRLPDK